MVKVQENTSTKALLVQIPKAIATAKGIQKGDSVDFLLNDKGEIVLLIKR